MTADKSEDYWTPERTYKHFKLYFTNGDWLLWNDCEVRFPNDRVVIHSKNGDTHSFILNNIAGYGYNKDE